MIERANLLVAIGPALAIGACGGGSATATEPAPVTTDAGVARPNSVAAAPTAVPPVSTPALPPTRRAVITLRVAGHPPRGVVDETASVIRARVRGERARVAVASGDRIRVRVADVGSRSRAAALARRLATSGAIAFYDWEPNVVGPGYRSDPTDQDLTGGPQAGGANSGVTRREADKRRAACAKRGTAVVVVRAELPGPTSGNEADRWYVLRARPALTAEDIKNPQQNYDNGPGGNHQPIVTFDFTPEGRRIWHDVTREIAQRGKANQRPGADALASAQHFAIVLGDELISVPYIDYRANPDGIDARHGSQIAGGFTLQSARGLAAMIRAGDLPAKVQVESVRVSG